MGFKDGLLYTGSRFHVLQDFYGGLAAVFSYTAMVERDLSIVKYVKNNFHTSLTDLSLKGILHAKQFILLEAIDTK